MQQAWVINWATLVVLFAGLVVVERDISALRGDLSVFRSDLSKNWTVDAQQTTAINKLVEVCK